jgi:hypothetical protein
VPSTVVTVWSVFFATASASAWLSVGLVESVPIGRVNATDVYVVRPAAFTATTKSPPITGTPLYVRSYGTYCMPPDEITGCCTNASSALEFRIGGRVATSADADRAAAVAVSLG